MLQWDTTDKSGRKVCQKKYTERLKFILKTSTFHEFRSLRARVAWLVHTRPDISCAVFFAAQITERIHDTQCKQALNRTVKHLKTAELQLRLAKLDLDSVRLLVCIDASRTNMERNRSQLGYLILLADKLDQCAFLHYSSYKSTRVTRSSMAGETLAFVEGFDCAYLIKHDLSRI